jgi:pimeloyl-ACP methyl ester carboxylesterase
VTGELSPSCPLRLSDRLQELLPNAEHVEIADASHAMTAQNAPAFNEAILAFLDRLSHRR